jgi:SsrA-binding protein
VDDKGSKTKKTDAVLCENRKARFNYHILETLEAGLVLLGTEVKSIRAGQVSLDESYVHTYADGIYLVGAHIKAYAPKGFDMPDPLRSRKLLLKKEEIDKLRGKVEQKGLTMVPLKLYLKQGFIKIEIALAKGKSAPDKRQSTRERESKREVERALKRG